MNRYDAIAASIMALPGRNRIGTLKFWGEWFVRPGVNKYVCVECHANGNVLVFRFDGGELLSVTEPSAVQLTSTSLMIQRAECVNWQWYNFGRPKTYANLCIREYQLKDGVIARVNNKPYEMHPKAIPDYGESAAVELVWEATRPGRPKTIAIF